MLNDIRLVNKRIEQCEAAILANPGDANPGNLVSQQTQLCKLRIVFQVDRQFLK